MTPSEIRYFTLHFSVWQRIRIPSTETHQLVEFLFIFYRKISVSRPKTLCCWRNLLWLLLKPHPELRLAKILITWPSSNSIYTRDLPRTEEEDERKIVAWKDDDFTF